MKTQLILAAALTTLLSGCADFNVDDAAIAMQSAAMASAQINQAAQAQAAQAGQMQAPEPSVYGQPTDSSTYYCRDATGSMVICRQIR